MNTHDAKQQTMRNLTSFLKMQDRPFYGFLNGRKKGAFSFLYKNNRQFLILYHIEGRVQRLCIDVYPKCICEAPYRNLVHSYLDHLHTNHSPARVIIDNETGEILIRSEIIIDSYPAAIRDIERVEKDASNLASALVGKLDKLCHGTYVDFDAYDLDTPFSCFDSDPFFDDDEDDDEYEDEDEDEDEDSISFFEDDEDDVNEEEADVDILSFFEGEGGESNSEEDSNTDATAESDVCDEDITETDDCPFTPYDRVDVILLYEGKHHLRVFHILRNLLNAPLSKVDHIMKSVPYRIYRDIPYIVASVAVKALRDVGAIVDVCPTKK